MCPAPSVPRERSEPLSSSRSSSRRSEAPQAANLNDVAAHAGVSIGTVSNVLNHPEIVSPKTFKRVQMAISDLGYVRNSAASQLRSGRSRSIGMIVLDVRNPFFTDVARGAEDEL